MYVCMYVRISYQWTDEKKIGSWVLEGSQCGKFISNHFTQILHTPMNE